MQTLREYKDAGYHSVYYTNNWGELYLVNLDLEIIEFCIGPFINFSTKSLNENVYEGQSNHIWNSKFESLEENDKRSMYAEEVIWYE